MYILVCADHSFYVGSTWDLERRVVEHNDGHGAAYTRRRRPVRLAYYEEYDRIAGMPSPGRSRCRTGTDASESR